MTDLYPEPPHLSAFVHTRLERSAALSAACEVLTSAGCVFDGDVLVARERQLFRRVSEVEREVIRHVGSLGALLTSCDVLRIRLVHRALGVVSLGLAPAFEFGELHPLEVAIHAGPLSFPVETWSHVDRQAARRVVDSLERLLLALARQTEAEYGGIGVEAAFPTPAQLAEAPRSPQWPTTWFWASRLGSAANSVEERLLSSLNEGAITRSQDGTVFRGWRPWVDRTVDDEGLARVVGFLKHTVANRS